MTEPTWIACLTPAGVGAIAVLALQGPGAWSMTRSLYRGRLPENPVPGKFYLGKLGTDANASDEVVLAVKGEGLELHCHGGVEVVRFIQKLFAERGATLGSWENISQRASPTAIKARNMLLNAPTVKTAAILLDQFHGALERTLAETQERQRNGNQDGATRLQARLEQTRHLGRHLVEPFRVVIAGPPNVGKSSIVNAIAGYGRSLVSPSAGTTRDVVTTRIALDGWPVELIDTAGLHESGDDLEQQGMARARAILDQADLRLWVLDASAAAVLPSAGIKVDGFIINKVDLPVAWREDGMKLTARTRVSARTGEGVTELCAWVGRLLRLDVELVPGEGVAFV
jgi:tRNA modification GTPase